MLDIAIYAAGKFVKTEKILEIQNPFSGEIFAKTYLADENLLEETILKAQSVEEELKNMPSWKKYKILMEIARKLEENKEELGKILCLEAAKPLKLALGEIERAIQVFIVAAEESKRYPGEVVQMDWTAAGEGRKGLVEYFPIGLVAGISPFNFPMNLAVHKIAPAIAASCPIILKPSSSTPLSTLKLAEIIDSTELPKGAVSILPMDRTTGNLLVTDERFKLLTFTGSPVVGWKMKAQSGKKKVVLELGGNAGLIISESCDLDLAVKKSVIGAFSYSGQVCIHTQRIFVHDKILNDFLEKFVEATKKLVIGNPENPETEISAMIDESNALRVEEWIMEAVNEGAKLMYGGKRKGALVEPTILMETKAGMKVCCQEVFGPVVIVEPFDDFKTAVAEVNNSEFGLQAGVFTNHLEEVKYAFSNLHVGGVMINDVPTFRVDHTPYGGIKNSGLGREGVKYAMLDMLEPKLLVY